jgi:hypothetical protein
MAGVPSGFLHGQDVGRGVFQGAYHAFGGKGGLAPNASGIGDPTANASFGLFGRGLDAAASAGANLVDSLTGRPSVTPDQHAAIRGLVSSGPPSADAILRTQRAFGGPTYEAQTMPGRYITAVERLLPAAGAGPENLFLRGTGLIGSGVGSQAGHDLAVGSGHPEWAPVMSTAGALIGGAPVVLTAGPSNAQRVIASETGGLTPGDLSATQELRQTGQALGFPVTVAEGASKVAGARADPLLRLQQRVERTPQGAATIGPIIQDRPSLTAQAIDDYVRQVAPATDQPSAVGVRAQAAAKGALGKLEAQRAAATAPHYQAAGPVTVDPDDMAGVMGDLDARIAADKTGVLAKPLSDVRDMLTDTAATQASAKTATTTPQTLRDSVEQAWAQVTGEAPPGASGGTSAAAGAVPSRVPILDVENLDRTRKFIRDQAAAKLANGSLTPEQAAAMNGVADRLDAAMERASPDYVAGKAVHAQMSRDVVEPAQAGPVGTIARYPDTVAGGGALYPQTPLAGAPEETASAIAALNEQDPLAAALLTRAHLERQAQARFGDVSAPDPYAGAGWASDVANGRGQRATMTAGLNALDPTGKLVGQFDDLVDALAATGRRLPATPAESAVVDRALSAGSAHPLETAVAAGVGREAFGHGGSIALPVAAKGYAMAKSAIDQARIRGNAQQLADFLTVTPEQMVEQIMEGRHRTSQQQALLGQILASGALAGSQAAAQ